MSLTGSSAEQNADAGNGAVHRPSSGVHDLLALGLLALALPALMPLSIPVLSIPVGLLAVLFAPGYGLAAAVFVRADDIDGPARVGISFGLSLAVVPLLALFLNFMPWGIRPWPITLSLSVWLLVTAGIAAVRRKRLSGNAAVGVRIRPRLVPAVAPATWWAKMDHGSRVVILAGIIALAMVAYSVYVAVTPGPQDRLTEFYALGAQGLAENYPRAVARGADFSIMLGVNNREGVAASYSIEVRYDGRIIKHSAGFRLRDGQGLQQPIRIDLDRAGQNQEIDVLLLRDGHPAPYRELVLWLNVQ